MIQNRRCLSCVVPSKVYLSKTVLRGSAINSRNHCEFPCSCWFVKGYYRTFLERLKSLVWTARAFMPAIGKRVEAAARHELNCRYAYYHFLQPPESTL